ncbi:Pichia stiptis repeat protein 2 [Scheffersomyces stipitis CBS 6054]|uniref:Pichia stiptis repeat protein 2 n=1 Tax=Scheffersomyces stipitis (strain ATCC 58785 / CBS 6054 / NBRC 10063 / NRRL Y-11545) TaxID=322104 RepID=A3LW85_PICST|nr:Pichia stiptis repeat protein 2 [Scheffersomyces stipitis CBS 6054]ABN67241.2 Pichia stiptis repeat protein 2 [Scheffersomyces stipitis CBS 6054]
MDIDAINQSEGPPGDSSHFNASNSALNEPKPPDIGRKRKTDVAPDDSMDLDGESSDAVENGELEPSFVTAGSVMADDSFDDTQEASNALNTLNEGPEMSIMDSFETSVSKNSSHHVIEEEHDPLLAAKGDTVMISPSPTSSSDLSKPTSTSDSVEITNVYIKEKNPKSQKNNLSENEEIKKNQENRKSKKQTSGAPLTDSIWNGQNASLQHHKNNSSIKLLSKDRLIKDLEKLGSGLNKNWEEDKFTDDLTFKKIRRLGFAKNYVTSHSQQEWAGEQGRIDRWNIPQEFLIDSLSLLGEHEYQKRAIELRIDRFEYKDTQLDPSKELSLKEKLEVIEDHFSHLPEKFYETALQLETKLKQVRAAKTNFLDLLAKATGEDKEARPSYLRAIHENEIQERDLMAQLTKENTLRAIVPLMMIRPLSNSTAYMSLSPIEGPKTSTQGPSLLMSLKKLLRQGYEGSTSDYYFKLSMIPSKPLANMFLVGLEHPSDHKNPEMAISELFNRGSMQITSSHNLNFSKFPSDVYSVEEKVKYEILVAHSERIRNTYYLDKDKEKSKSFYLIATDSGKVPTRKNANLPNYSLEIISTFKFCSYCHESDHPTFKCTKTNKNRTTYYPLSTPMVATYTSARESTTDNGSKFRKVRTGAFTEVTKGVKPQKIQQTIVNHGSNSFMNLPMEEPPSSTTDPTSTTAFSRQPTSTPTTPRQRQTQSQTPATKTKTTQDLDSEDIVIQTTTSIQTEANTITPPSTPFTVQTHKTTDTPSSMGASSTRRTPYSRPINKRQDATSPTQRLEPLRARKTPSRQNTAQLADARSWSERYPQRLRDNPPKTGSVDFSFSQIGSSIDPLKSTNTTPAMISSPIGSSFSITEASQQQLANPIQLRSEVLPSQDTIPDWSTLQDTSTNDTPSQLN